MLTKLREAFERIKNATLLSDETIELALRDIQRALIASDVDVNIVFNLTNELRNIAKQKPAKGLNRREFIIKRTYEMLAAILKQKEHAPLNPKRILLVGLYGQGKTTTAAKLALWYAKRGASVLLLCLDDQRPASFEQLKQLAEKANVEFFGIKGEKPVRVAEKALAKYRDKLIIADSAGRDALDESLIEEIKKVKQVLQPDQIWLVLSADIGQLARKQAKAFHEALGINGIILTKTDSSFKAGGAIAACAETNSSVYFIGTGEKLEDFEEFDAESYLAKLLGFVDIKGLLRKASELEIEPELSEEFTLETFRKQLEEAKKFGPIDKIAELFGIKASLPREELELSEQKLKKYKAILDSMTKYERLHAEVIDSSRIKRIARGSGTKESDVRALLRDFRKAKKMQEKVMKMVKKGRELSEEDIAKLLKKFAPKKRKFAW